MWTALIDFVLGPPTPAIATMILVTGLNTVLGVLTARNKQAALRQEWKRPVAYLLFYIAAHRLDALLIDGLFGWQGSTKLLVVLGLLAKDGRQLLARVSQWSGVPAPAILDGRLQQVEQGELQGELIDSRALDRKLEELRASLEDLRARDRGKRGAQDVGESEDEMESPFTGGV